MLFTVSCYLTPTPPSGFVPFLPLSLLVSVMCRFTVRAKPLNRWLPLTCVTCDEEVVDGVGSQPDPFLWPADTEMVDGRWPVITKRLRRLADRVGQLVSFVVRSRQSAPPMIAYPAECCLLAAAPSIRRAGAPHRSPRPPRCPCSAPPAVEALPARPAPRGREL